MGILKSLVWIIIALLFIFLVGGFFIPEQWMVTRSIVINAKAKKIYPYISQFKKMNEWMPATAKDDSSMKYTYEGPEVGVDSKQSWTSKKFGNGFMQITAANPPKSVSYYLYVDLNESQTSLQGNITLTPVDKSTKVTWSEKWTQKSYIKRWMSSIIKYIIVRDFNHSLVDLKNLVENEKKS